MYFINGWYYLMTAEGGTAQGHAITMARSRSMHGLFEVDPENPMLTARDVQDWLIQYAGHGDLLQAADGAWYLFHLASRKKDFGGWSVLGRETWMQNVYWNDEGWLRLTAGGHLPKETATVPGDVEQRERFFGEIRFDTSALDPRLMSLRIPADERLCSLTARPGWLRLYGQHSILCQHRQPRRRPHPRRLRREPPALLRPRQRKDHFVPRLKPESAGRFAKLTEGAICFGNGSAPDCACAKTIEGTFQNTLCFEMSPS